LLILLILSKKVPPQAAKFMMEESRQDIQRYAFEEKDRIM